MPISKWVDQKTVVHLHNGVLHSRKKEGTPTLCNSMDGTGEHHAKWNNPGIDKQIPYDLTYKWNLIKQVAFLKPQNVTLIFLISSRFGLACTHDVHNIFKMIVIICWSFWQPGITRTGNLNPLKEEFTRLRQHPASFPLLQLLLLCGEGRREKAKLYEECCSLWV